MIASAPGREPPVYRVFAVMAYAATCLVGAPIGMWMLGWRYVGFDAVPVEWVRLHGSVQILGFFATLIPGIAEHLFARFTGQAVTRGARLRVLAALLGSALALRVLGTWADSGWSMLAAAGLQSAALLLFTWRVWRALDRPPLAPLRRHLTASSGWLAAAAMVEGGAWAGALAAGLAAPSGECFDIAYSMALVGGVSGWVLGVLHRAGPMFVAGWTAPPRGVGALPWALAAAVVIHACGRFLASDASWGMRLGALGDTLAYWVIVAVLVAGGALRPAPRSLPMVARSEEESRIFRLGVAAAIAAAVVSSAGLALAVVAASDALTGDAARHLLTVGFLTSTVLAMTFRLVPVLEGRPLVWPGCRRVARWALAGAIALRTLEVLVALGAVQLAPAVAASGPLAWTALLGGGAMVAAAALGLPRTPEAG